MVAASNIWIIDILNILLSTLIISGFLSSLSKANFKEKRLDLYYNNWANGLINDIEICDENDKISNYLINEKFPATQIGCSCEYSNLIGLKMNVFPFFCTDFYLENSCINYFGSNSANITMWKNEKLCVHRQNKTYFDYLKDIEINEKEIEKRNLLDEKKNPNYFDKYCKIGYKKCGYLDSYYQPLCIMENENCPINSIVKGEYLKSISNNSTNNQFGNFTMIGSGNFYYSKNSNNNTALNSFRITSNGQCANPQEGNIGENEYVLNSYKGPSSCDYYINGMNKDSRLKYLDSEKTSLLYNENKIYIENIPLYPVKYENENSILQTTGYYGIKLECLRKYNSKIGIENLIKLQKKTESQINYLMFILSTLGITHFFISILFVIIYKILISKFNPLFLGIVIFDIVNCSLLISIIIFCFKCKNIVVDITAPFLYIKENKCIDQYTTYLFSKEYDKLFQIIINLNVVIGFTITFIILLIIHYGVIIFLKNGPIIKVKLK